MNIHIYGIVIVSRAVQDMAIKDKHLLSCHFDLLDTRKSGIITEGNICQYLIKSGMGEKPAKAQSKKLIKRMDPTSTNKGEIKLEDFLRANIISKLRTHLGSRAEVQLTCLRLLDPNNTGKIDADFLEKQLDASMSIDEKQRFMQRLKKHIKTEKANNDNKNNNNYNSNNNKNKSANKTETNGKEGKEDKEDAAMKELKEPTEAKEASDNDTNTKKESHVVELNSKKTTNKITNKTTKKHVTIKTPVPKTPDDRSLHFPEVVVGGSSPGSIEFEFHSYSPSNPSHLSYISNTSLNGPKLISGQASSSLNVTHLSKQASKESTVLTQIDMDLLQKIGSREATPTASVGTIDLEAFDITVSGNPANDPDMYDEDEDEGAGSGSDGADGEEVVGRRTHMHVGGKSSSYNNNMIGARLSKKTSARTSPRTSNTGPGTLVINMASEYLLSEGFDSDKESTQTTNMNENYVHYGNYGNYSFRVNNKDAGISGRATPITDVDPEQQPKLGHFIHSSSFYKIGDLIDDLLPIDGETKDNNNNNKNNNNNNDKKNNSGRDIKRDHTISVDNVLDLIDNPDLVYTPEKTPRARGENNHHHQHHNHDDDDHSAGGDGDGDGDDGHYNDEDLSAFLKDMDESTVHGSPHGGVDNTIIRQNTYTYSSKFTYHQSARTLSHYDSHKSLPEADEEFYE